MPQIGPLEILLVAAIALIVFGPQRLPEVARSVGRTISELRRMAEDIRSEFRDDAATPDGRGAPAPGSIGDDVAVLNAPPAPPATAQEETPDAQPESGESRSSGQDDAPRAHPQSRDE